mmetsp:Transcript_27795/g.26851  ORF Transcript_27795/g.26851 Transcript_27795/m.26851 type:complete len:223 (-) Transcript_27795:403-1071(-)
MDKVKHLLVLGHDDPFSDGEVGFVFIIDDWPRVRISHKAHLRHKKGFRGTHIPVFEPRNKVQITICILIEKIHDLVAGACDLDSVEGIDCFENIVHYELVVIVGAAEPKLVVLLCDGIVSREGEQSRHSLKSLKFFWKFILHKDSAFRGTKVGPPLTVLLVIEGLVDDSNPWALVDRHSNEAGDMVSVSFSKALSPIQWIYPNHHVVLNNLIRELIVIPVCI